MMTEALGWAGDVSCRVQRSTFRRLAASNSFMQGAAPKVYLSLWNVIALGIGSMVGAGIFALMGQATLMAGKNVYWSFLIGGVAALLSGYTYARLGSRYPGSGGIMDYFNKGFSHKTLAGALTLIYLGTLVITVALVAKSFGAYASRLFLPDESVTVFTTGLFSSIAILLLGALNMGGVKAVGKSEVVLVAFKLLILTIRCSPASVLPCCWGGRHSRQGPGRTVGKRGPHLLCLCRIRHDGQYGRQSSKSRQDASPRHLSGDRRCDGFVSGAVIRGSDQCLRVLLGQACGNRRGAGGLSCFGRMGIRGRIRGSPDCDWHLQSTPQCSACWTFPGDWPATGS